MKTSQEYSCEGCPARCCKTLFLQKVNRPRTAKERKRLIWYLRYDKIEYVVINRRWFLLVRSTCRYLTDNNRCSIYENRPKPCQDYSPRDCEQHSTDFEAVIRSEEDLLRYLQSREGFMKEKKNCLTVTFPAVQS